MRILLFYSILLDKSNLVSSWLSADILHPEEEWSFESHIFIPGRRNFAELRQTDTSVSVFMSQTLIAAELKNKL